MKLTQIEEIILVAIDTLTIEGKSCSIQNIAIQTEPPLNVTETRAAGRQLLHKGFLSFVKPGNADPYVELTSIGDIQVKHIIEGLA